MADDPLAKENFSGSFDDDPSTSAGSGGGSDSGGGSGSDDDNDSRRDRSVLDQIVGGVEDTVDRAVDDAERVAERAREAAQEQNRQQNATDDDGGRDRSPTRDSQQDTRDRQQQSQQDRQDQIDEALSDSGAAGSGRVDDPTTPNSEERGERNPGTQGPFPDSGPAGSNPNVQRGDVNLPDAARGDLTDEAADGAITRSEVVAETRDIEAPGPTGDRQERRQPRLGEDPQAQQRQIQRARQRLRRRAIQQSAAVDEADDVRIQREGDTLRATLSEQGVREAIAAQSPVVDDPSNIDISGDPQAAASALGAGAIDLAGTVGGGSDRDRQQTDTTRRSDVPDSLRRVGVGQSQQSAAPIGGIGFDGGTGDVDPGTPRQQTRAPGVTQDVREANTSRQTVSPFAGIGLSGASDEEIAQAVEGSREVARRANEGNVGAQVAEVGRRLQEQGGAITGGVEDALPLEDAGPQVGDATVGQQVEGFVGGAAGFPVQLLGGGVQAGGLAATEPVSQDTVSELPDSLARAGTAQGQFVQDRPVEAGLIVATAAAGSARARSAARQAGRSAAESGRGALSRANDRLGFRDPARRFRTDESGALGRQRPQRSQSQQSGQSRSRNTDQSDLDTGLDPRVFERNRGRGGGQRSAGVDTPTGRRPGRGGLEAQRSFAQRYREFRNIEEGVPTSDLRTVSEFDAPTQTTGATAGSAGALLSAEQEALVTAESPLDATGGSGRTQGGPADAVTRDAQSRLAQAQEATVSVDEVLSGQADGPLATTTTDSGTGADARTRSRQQQDQLLGESDAVQGSRVTGSEGRPSVGDDTGVGTRPGEQVGPGDDQTVGVGVEDQPEQGQTPRQGNPPNTQQRPRQQPIPGLGVPELGVPDTDVPNDPRNGDPPGPRRGPPRRPRGPSGLGFSLLGGVGVGGQRAPQTGGADDELLDPGYLNETFATIATQGRQAIDAPSQQTLRRQPESVQLTGQLPTALEVSGSEEEQQQFQSVQSIFSFGGVDVAGSSPSSASEPQGSTGGFGFALDLDFGGDEDDGDLL